jgi:hypothetical protein
MVFVHNEHDNTLTPSLGANIPQINRQTSTTGVEFMDPALDALIATLTSIRDQADSVLRKIDQLRRERSLGWKWSACGTQPKLRNLQILGISKSVPAFTGSLRLC